MQKNEKKSLALNLWYVCGLNVAKFPNEGRNLKIRGEILLLWGEI